ncbi:MAG: SMP-30/gluconolactonase/LRE family protein [Gemmatimonadales bacterium]
MRKLVRFVLCGAALAGCKKADNTPPPAQPVKVASAEGLQTPESALHDAAQDVYFVSNINGNANAKDGNGFISRVRPDGSVENLTFIAGGRNGVTLHAPKGMAVRGDTLWVTDIDAVRAFDARTGTPAAAVDLSKQGAVFLNDPAFGPDGALYVTDSGILFDEQGGMQHPGPDRIFRIGPDRKVSVAVQGDVLQQPNGITWDAAGSRFLLAPLGGPSIFAWKPGDQAPTVIATGPAGYDGVEVGRGRLLVSSWTDSTVSAYEGGTEVKLITGMAGPADIGYDATRNRVLIPVMLANRLEIWQLP